MRGPPAGVSFSCSTASAKLDCMTSPSTSWRTCWPNCWRTTLTGTLPGPETLEAHGAAELQPLVDRLFDLLRRDLISIRRSSVPVDSTETCMDSTIL